MRSQFHGFPQANKFSCLVACFLLLAFTGAKASEPSLEQLSGEISSIDSQLNLAEPKVQAKDANERALSSLKTQLTGLRTKALELAAVTEQSAAKSTDRLKSLGPATPEEAPELNQARKELEQESNQLNQKAAQFRLLLIRTEDLINAVSERQKNLLQQKLLNRGPFFTELLREHFLTDKDGFSPLLKQLASNSGVTLLQSHHYIATVLLLILSFTLGYWLKKRLLHWSDAHQWNEHFISGLNHAFITTGARYLPLLIASTTFAIALFLLIHDTRPVPLLAVIAYTLPLLFIAAFIGDVFFLPRRPATVFLNIDTHVAKALGKRLRLLSLLAFCTLVFLLSTHDLRGVDTSLLLARDIFSSLLIINLLWLLISAGKIEQLRKTWWLRTTLILFFSALLLMELVGYRNLSMNLLRIVVSSLLAYSLFLLIHYLFKEFFNAIDEGSRIWHRPIRMALGLRPGEHFPGLRGFRFITGIILWSAFVFVLIKILGYSEELGNRFQTYITEGFNFGSLNINPARLLLAAIVFAILYSISGWIRSRLEKSWLRNLRLERGAREALITISGYLGVALALLVALGVAGVTFTNLAIIAGALSVGIGFGLQNIVNNFVSGLILLFERPVKKGDWVIVGNTEGYVKKISIRSTQIQTFDRADVIVPNSDLISNQVTNWMLYDQRGRIRVPVGVAYGTDTEKVKELLSEIASTHPNIINGLTDFPIKVYFIGFGDSALNFELRCFIQNIDERISVTSDLNFAIDKAFREQGIEIPFPQRDVHIKQPQQP